MARHRVLRFGLLLLLAAAELLAQPLLVKDEAGQPVAGAKVEVLWYVEEGLFCPLDPRPNGGLDR